MRCSISRDPKTRGIANELKDRYNASAQITAITNEKDNSEMPPPVMLDTTAKIINETE